MPVTSLMSLSSATGIRNICLLKIYARLFKFFIDVGEEDDELLYYIITSKYN